MSVPPAPPQRDERRTEALKTALAQIEKQFGKGSIMRLGGDAKLDIEGITTGSLGLDLALGGKGFPRGRPRRRRELRWCRGRSVRDT